MQKVVSSIIIVAIIFLFSQVYFFNFSLIPAAQAAVNYTVNNAGGCDDTDGDPYYCTIQAAVDDVPTSTTLTESYTITVVGGGSDYVLSADITINDKWGTAGNQLIIQTSTGAVIDANGGGNQIQIDNSKYVTVDGFTYTNISGNGIDANSSTNLTIQNNSIYNATSGSVAALISLDSVTGGTVDNNTLHTATGGGLGGIGVHLLGTTSDVTLENNTIYNTEIAFYMADDSTSNTIRYNTIYGNSLGFSFDLSPNTVSDNVVTHNLIYDNDAGISAPVLNGNTFTYNTFDSNTCGAGLLGSQTNGDPFVFRNNIISNNATATGCASTNYGDYANLPNSGIGGLFLYAGVVPYKYADVDYNLFYNNGWQYDAGNEHVGWYDGVNSGFAGTENDINTLDATLTNLTMEGNVIGDPDFVDRDGADDTLGFDSGTNYGTDDNYTVGPNGAGIDGADPADIYAYEPSPSGNRANIGRYGNTAYAAITAGDTDVDVTASVEPILSFTIRDSADSSDSNICNLGSMTSGSVNTCSYRIATETNATSGYTVKLVADGPLTSGSDTIDNISSQGTVSAGTEGYGVAVVGASAGGPSGGVTVGSSFDTNDNPVPLTATDIISTNEPFDYTSGNTTTSSLIQHKVGISQLTPAGTYTQTLTYTVTGNF